MISVPGEAAARAAAPIFAVIDAVVLGFMTRMRGMGLRVHSKPKGARKPSPRSWGRWPDEVGSDGVRRAGLGLCSACMSVVQACRRPSLADRTPSGLASQVHLPQLRGEGFPRHFLTV